MAKQQQTTEERITQQPGAAGIDLDNPPSPLPLSSFPEYARLTGHIADITQRRQRIEVEVARLQDELNEARMGKGISKAAASKMLKGASLPDRLASESGVDPLEKALGLAYKERRLLASLAEQAEKDRQHLAGKLSSAACEPIRAYWRALAPMLAAVLVEARTICRAEAQIFAALDDAGISAAGLSPTGGAMRPLWIGDLSLDDAGRISGYLKELADTGLLDPADPLANVPTLDQTLRYSDGTPIKLNKDGTLVTTKTLAGRLAKMVGVG